SAIWRQTSSARSWAREPISTSIPTDPSRAASALPAGPVAPMIATRTGDRVARSADMQVFRVGHLELGPHRLADDLDHLVAPVVERAVADGPGQLGLVAHAQTGQRGGVRLPLLRPQPDLALDHPQHVHRHAGV